MSPPYAHSMRESLEVDRLLANNPGPFTGSGTNTWVVGDGEGAAAVIDPGPVDTPHLTAVMEAVGRRRVEAVLVTHTHLDHAPMAKPLARELGVPAVGHAPGPHFQPDIRLLDGAVFEVGSLPLEVIHTPGHSPDHLCYRAGDVLFSGDHIIGGSTVMVEELRPYLASLEKLKGRGLRRLYPGHGEEVDDPEGVIDRYLEHRRQRHREVLEAVESGCQSVTEIVETVYADVDRSLHPLAARSVEAHLALLAEEEKVAWQDDRVTFLSP